MSLPNIIGNVCVSSYYVILGGLVVRVFAIGPFSPRFAGSNLVEGSGFLRAIKSAAHLPLDGKYSCQPHVARFTACYKPFEV
jgi:hypothetical protein